MATPTQTVYSYYMPEVRRVVQDTLGLQTHRLNAQLQQNYDPGLDDIHEPLMDKFETHGRTNGVIGWNSFSNRYFTNGSSEGIFHLLARHKAELPGVPIYQLEGEYQGYEEYAKALGLRIWTVSEQEVIDDWYYDHHPDQRPSRELDPGVFLVSNPSARDGNLLSPSLWKAIIHRHATILDLAYLGMTDPIELDLTYRNVVAVVASMSKPFGLYYFRSGFLWSREPVDSLYGNRWFKNAASIMVAEAVLDQVPAASLREIYRPKQKSAVISANYKFAGIHSPDIRASDVWLLANWYRKSGVYEDSDLKDFRRGDDRRHRFCLTPYYMEAEHV